MDLLKLEDHTDAKNDGEFKERDRFETSYCNVITRHKKIIEY